MMFPDVSYELDEGYQKALKGSNGEYTIFISWSNDKKVSITFDRVQ